MNKLIFLLFVLSPGFSFCQDPILAAQYFQNGEYEKAQSLYQQLNEKDPGNDFYFQRYFDCLLNLENYVEGEKLLKKSLKRDPNLVHLYVTYGNLYERQFKEPEAKEQFEKALKKLPAEQVAVARLANAFTNLAKYDYAIEAYERGGQLLNNPFIFAYNLADLYRRKGDSPKMVEAYLNYLVTQPAYLESLKSLFSRYLMAEEDYAELQSQLYLRIQDDPLNPLWPELLTWSFIQKKDYANALRQAKALDRQLNENGLRVYNIGQTAANDKQYDAAIEAYDYIVKDKGPTSNFYLDAKRESLACKRKKVVDGFSYTEADLRALEAEYDGFLTEFGRSKLTAKILLELAELQAFYINDRTKAIALLTEVIAYPGIDRTVQARGKISLADYYLMEGERWESTLLYSQVDKDFKDDLLGQEARFKNAKLSYFNGDFEWAQAQFDVLKASTSKLIANDALDLAVFIMDNMGLDTTDEALTLYSEADLLVFQNRFPEAFLKLDTLKTKFPEHALADDIAYLKAQVALKKREWQTAADLYQFIVDKFWEDIRADNALFGLAELYETHLANLEKAKELYEKLFTDKSGSTFAVDARKRFRILRGDKVQ